MSSFLEHVKTWVNPIGAVKNAYGAVKDQIDPGEPVPPPPPPPRTASDPAAPTTSGYRYGYGPGVATAPLPAPPARTTVPPPVIAPITTTAGVSGESEWTDAQREAAAALRATLAGTTPSLAAIQQKEAFDRASAEQLSMAAGARGRSVAAGNRIAAQNIAQLHQQAASEGAKLRAEEVAKATEDLGKLGTEARGQDIDVEKADADLTLRAAIASDDRVYGAAVENAKNALAAVGLDDKYVSDWLGNWLILRGQNQTERTAIMERDLRMWLQNHPQAKDFWDKLASVSGLLGGAGQGVAAAGKAGA